MVPAGDIVVPAQLPSAMDWTALFLTLRLALVVCLLLLALGVPLGYWVAFSRWRGKFLVEALVTLPLVLPPTVLGFYVLVALGPRSPLGQLFTAVFGHPLPFTFGGLVIASVIYSGPFMVQPVASAFAAVDARLLAASATLGVSRFGTFRRVILPLSFSGILTGLVLSFAHTLGEFGVVLMVGGNLPGITRTLSVSIYDRVQALDYASAAATSLFLLVLSFVLLALIYGLNRNARAIWPGAR
jgi:molybdate transport system permease protein